MIVVRNVFRLKFGQARPAAQVWKEGGALMHKVGLGGSYRLLSDLTGPSYTCVLEINFESLADFEKQSKSLMAMPEWRTWYEKLIPFCESGYREVFTLVE